MRKFTLFFVFLLFVGMHAALAQMEVKGTVTDAKDGTPLPGVSIVVKGTLTGTVTDINGKFVLTVPAGYNELIFSFVGMLTREEKIDGRAVINITLEDDVVGLNEVVVTALGISREKKSIGYAVQDMKGEELAKAKETNIVNSLSGKIAGVQITNSSGAVGSSSRIVIRGAGSLGGNNQPLFVVDGIPINNDDFAAGDGLGGKGRVVSKNNGTNRGNGAADINPDDIESISVLKGPNAAALYGSRAANGVILITTKSGSLSGTTRKGLNIELSNSTTFERPLRLPDYQNEYGQGAEGVFSYVDGAGGGTKDGVDESWGPKLDAGLMLPQYDSPIVDGVRTATPWISHPDNIKDFLETGVTTTTNLAIVGGYTDANFRLSYTNMNQTGMLPNTDYKKNTLAFGASANATDKLNISGSVNYVSATSDNLPAYGYDAQNVFQQFIWASRQVNYSDLKNYTNPDGSKYNWNYNYHNNPYFTLNENLNTLDRDRLFGNAKVLYKFTENLSAFVRTGIDNYSNLSTERAAYGDMDNPNGFYDEALSTFKEINTDALIMFDKGLGEYFDLNVNLGGNIMNQNFHRTFGAADELAVADVYTLANSKVALRSTSFFREKSIHSLYFSGQLGFKNALFLEFTGRNDWSSTLPKESWSYFYPSFTLSAVITDLAKMDNKVLSYAKVRVGYAVVGSDTDPYNLLPVLSFGSGWNSATKYLNQYVPDGLPNPELKPQKVYGFETGAELKFFLNRISLDFTYYNQQTKNQIIAIPVSASSGYTSKFINAGQIDNSGIEITLGASPVKSDKGFNWDIYLNFAKNKNEVVSLAEGVEQYELGTYWDLKVMAIPGQPYGSLYGADYLRDPDGNIINRNGVPVKGDLKILGNYQPDWIGGINNEFNFKGFDLSFLIDVHMGGDVYCMTNAWGRYAGAIEETLIGREGGIVGIGVKEVEDADGNITYVPNDVVVTAEEYNHAAFTNSIPAGSIFDASYVKLREVRLGYTFKNLGNFPIKGINISIVGRNLAILYSTVPHVDPETSFTNGNVQGLEFGQLPSARSLGFNINLKF
ncbi:MAG: SusC/RagA family TonB-linked outer membrane protein [Bacteroidales bacterium]|nr:SusC/RagA family TonB-linked outer membrane protein [Bacteroidales bacterium]